MDKYVLTLEQLKEFVEYSELLLHKQKGVDDIAKDYIVNDFIKENSIPTTAKLEYDAWSEGFDKAKKTAFEALEQFKTK